MKINSETMWALWHPRCGFGNTFYSMKYQAKEWECAGWKVVKVKISAIERKA